MPTRPFVLAALIVAAAPLHAECPTSADLEAGIVLAQNTPFFLRGDFKAVDEGIVERRVMVVGGEAVESMALYRHGLVMTGEHSPTGHVEITYVDDLAGVYHLPDTGKAAISGIAKGPLGDAYVELELEYLGSSTLTLGECAFETWQVASSLKDRSGAGAVFELDYAPELGVVLGARLIGDDGSRSPTYAYQWAGTAAEIANGNQ